MRKLFACLLVAMLLVSSCTALAETALEAAAEAAEEFIPVDDGTVTIYSVAPVEDTIGIQEGTQITVGSSTELSGVFSTEMWGNNTADMDARSLLHSYQTVAWTRTQGLAFNGIAVERVDVDNNEEGDRTYTIEISKNLVYSDGTPITAKDYVFSLLLSGAPEIAAIGGMPLGLSHMVGYEEYRQGETETLEGVSLISDYVFSITIDNEFLPYFYGLAMLNVTPFPMFVIAPGCDIFDDGQGAYLAAGEDAATIQAEGFTPGEFSAQMLEKTMLDPETGYISNPQVVSGPYTLESYDPQNATATFLINPLFVGNYEGQTPHIERITLRLVRNESMMTDLRNGDVNLLNKVANVVPVTEGINMADRENLVQRINYPRTGFAFLAFACEEGPASYTSVRQAVARCIDKQELVVETLGTTNGLPVYGYYGLGQWMINQNFQADEEAGLDALSVQDELNSYFVTRDLSAAKSLLVNDGWNLNENGTAFIDGVDTVRHRMVDGELMPLVLKWAKTAESSVATYLEDALRSGFAEIGIGLEVYELPFSDVLSHYYRQRERTYDLFFLASNFQYVFDPYFDFNTAEIYQGMINTSGLQDEKMMELAWNMRITPSNDMREYVTRWLAFQDYWVSQMPMVPLYSNVYFDFYPNDLQSYQITEHAGWSLAIPYAYFGEAPEDLEFIDEDLFTVDGMGDGAALGGE